MISSKIHIFIFYTNKNNQIMKYLKLSCTNGITGPVIENVNVGGTPFNIWTVSGKGIVIEYDADGNEVPVQGSGNYKGIFVYPSYRKLTCGGGADEYIVYGVAEIEAIEGE